MISAGIENHVAMLWMCPETLPAGATLGCGSWLPAASPRHPASRCGLPLETAEDQGGWWEAVHSDASSLAIWNCFNKWVALEGHLWNMPWTDGPMNLRPPVEGELAWRPYLGMLAQTATSKNHENGVRNIHWASLSTIEHYWAEFPHCHEGDSGAGSLQPESHMHEGVPHNTTSGRVYILNHICHFLMYTVHLIQLSFTHGISQHRWVLLIFILALPRSFAIRSVAMSEALRLAQDKRCESWITDEDLCDAVAFVGPERQRVPFLRAPLATLSKPLKVALYGD